MNYIKKSLLLFILLFSFACKNSDDYLERIYVKENWEHDGILYLVESADATPRISDDSLKYYVTSEEEKAALDSFVLIPDSINGLSDTFHGRRLIFKNYGRIFSDREFTVYTILKINPESGRDYTFYLRTYDNNKKMIDSLPFAAWIEHNIFFSGEFSRNLEVERIYKDRASEHFKLNKNGKFLKIQKE